MNTGLEGVVVCETQLSEVDGSAGRLIIRGETLEDFTERDYESATEILLGPNLDLGKGRVSAYRHLQNLLGHLQQRTPIDALRLGLAALPSEVEIETIIGAFPVILGAQQHGERLESPSESGSHVHDLLRLFLQRDPAEQEILGITTYLVTVTEHGMNASTFTARVVASTGAPDLDAVLAALGALKGPLHGGAPGPVLDLLDELKTVQDLRENLATRIRAGERLMGFGHRIYKTRDPRADVLRNAVLRLSASDRLRHAERVETHAREALEDVKPGRKLDTNVEFYTAVLLEQLGFHRNLFTPLFATGRVLGWLAHIQEQRSVGRLIRPASTYVGPVPAGL